MFDRSVYPYIKYRVGEVTYLLTPRPDAYELEGVNKFIAEYNPVVRFQFTDDIPNYKATLPVHWYPWIPGKRLPTELVYAALSLIDTYARPGATIWMHCDSSSMRAPTFFGHWLAINYNKETIDALIAKAIWTDGRQQSSPLEYHQTSLKMDDGMKELIEAWFQGGQKKAYEQIMKVKYPWDEDEHEAMATAFDRYLEKAGIDGNYSNNNDEYGDAFGIFKAGVKFKETK